MAKRTRAERARQGSVQKPSRRGQVQITRGGRSVYVRPNHPYLQQSASAARQSPLPSSAPPNKPKVAKISKTFQSRKAGPSQQERPTYKAPKQKEKKGPVKRFFDEELKTTKKGKPKVVVREEPVLKRSADKVRRAGRELQRDLRQVRRSGAPKTDRRFAKAALTSAFIRRNYELRRKRPTPVPRTRKRKYYVSKRGELVSKRQVDREVVKPIREQQKAKRQAQGPNRPRAKRRIPTLNRKMASLNERIERTENQLSNHGRIIQRKHVGGYLGETSRDRPSVFDQFDLTPSDEARVTSQLHERLSRLNKQKARTARKLEAAQGRRTQRHLARDIGEEAGWVDDGVAAKIGGAIGGVAKFAAKPSIPNPLNKLPHVEVAGQHLLGPSNDPVSLGPPNLADVEEFSPADIASAIPAARAANYGLRGILGLSAKGSKYGGEALTSALAVKAARPALRQLEGTAAARLAAMKVPAALGHRYGPKFAKRPLWTAMKLAGVTTVGVGAARHHKEFVNGLADVATKFANNPIPDEEVVDDVLRVMERSPRATLEFVKAFVEDPRVREETMKALPSYGLYAVVFPVHVGATVVREGPTKGTAEIANQLYKEAHHFFGPVMGEGDPDWDKYRQRMREPGRGGILTPASTLVPFFGALSRGSMAGAKFAAKKAKRPDIVAALETRPALEFAGGFDVMGRHGAKGAIYRTVQAIQDSIAKGVAKRGGAARRVKYGLPVEAPAKSVPYILPRLHTRQASKEGARIAAEQDVAQSARAKQFLGPLQRLWNKHNQDKAFSYAVASGVPETPAAFVENLRAWRDLIGRNKTDQAQPMLPEIDALIEQYSKPGAKFSGSFLNDARNVRDLTHELDLEASWFNPAQLDARQQMLQAELLLHRQRLERGGEDTYGLAEVRAQQQRRADPSEAQAADAAIEHLLAQQRGVVPRQGALAPEQASSHQPVPRNPVEAGEARQQTAAEFAPELQGPRVQAVDAKPAAEVAVGDVIGGRTVSRVTNRKDGKVQVTLGDGKGKGSRPTFKPDEQVQVGPRQPEAAPTPEAPPREPYIGVPARESKYVREPLPDPRTPMEVSRQNELDIAQRKLDEARAAEREAVELRPDRVTERREPKQKHIDDLDNAIANASKKYAEALRYEDGLQTRISNIYESLNKGKQRPMSAREKKRLNRLKGRMTRAEAIRDKAIKDRDKRIKLAKDNKERISRKERAEMQAKIKKWNGLFKSARTQFEDLSALIGARGAPKSVRLELVRLTRARAKQKDRVRDRKAALDEAKAAREEIRGGISTSRPLRWDEVRPYNLVIRERTRLRQEAQQARDAAQKALAAAKRARTSKLGPEQFPTPRLRQVREGSEPTVIAPKGRVPVSEPKPLPEPKYLALPRGERRGAPDPNYRGPLRRAADRATNIFHGPPEFYEGVRARHSAQAAFRAGERAREPLPTGRTVPELPEIYEVMGETPAAQMRTLVASERSNVARLKEQVRALRSGLQQAKVSIGNRRGAIANLKGKKNAKKRAKAEQELANLRRQRNDLHRDLKRRQTELNRAESRLRATEKAHQQTLAKAKKQDRDPYLRTSRDDIAEYTRRVGPQLIDEVAAARGLERPGYFGAMVDNVTTGPPGVYRATNTIKPQATRNILFREGRADMSPLHQYDIMVRLNNTITKARGTAIYAARGTSPLREWLEGAPDNLNASETYRALHEAGYDTSKLALVNYDGLRQLTGIMNREVVPRERMTDAQQQLDDLVREGQRNQKRQADYDYQVQFEDAVLAAMDEVMITPDQSLKFSRREQPRASDAQDRMRGWGVGDARAQYGFQARMNPLSSKFGGGDVMRAFARSKMVASQWLLLHPAWALSQVYANAMLMTVTQPQAWATLNMGKWLDELPSVQRQEFFGKVGVPAHHTDYSQQGHALLAGVWGVKSAMNMVNENPTYIKHFRGRGGPKSKFFAFDVRETTYFTSKALHSKMKTRALRNMEGAVNRYLVRLDEALTALGKSSRTKRQVKLDEEMTKLLQDEQLMAHLGREVHSIMGDYNVFTPRERNIIANNVLFYGFMRHSLMLALWTLPTKNPVRAALLTDMGKLVERDQFNQYVDKYRENYEAFATHYLIRKRGYTPEEAASVAAQMAKRWRPEAGRLPVGMWGNYMIPGSDDIISLRKASFIGSSPIEAAITGRPLAMVSSIAPVATEAAGLMFFGTDMFSGQPLTTHAADTQKEPGFNPLSPLDWPKVGAASALGYFAPARYLSQTQSELPTAERTSTSFPLPLWNPLPEVAMQEKTKLGKQYQDALRRFETAENQPIEVLKAELFYPGHLSTAIQVDMLYDIKSKAKEAGHLSETRKKKVDKAEEKKPSLRDRFGPIMPDESTIDPQAFGNVYPPPERDLQDKYGPAYLPGTGPTGANKYGPAYPESTAKNLPAEEGIDVELDQIAHVILGITPRSKARKKLAREPNPNKGYQHAPPPRQKASGGLLGAISAGIDYLQGDLPAQNKLPSSARRTSLLPPQRPQEAKSLRAQLKRVAAKRGGGISGPLTASQKTFGETLAKQTGLSPRVIGAWMLAENSDQNAIEKEQSGYHNWLNIGPFLESPKFADPTTAGKATADFLKGKIWGPGARIPEIIKTAGQSDEAQMRMIEQSGFSATGYGAGGTLAGTYAQVQSKPTKPIPRRLLQRATRALGKKEVRRILDGPDQPYQLQTQELFHDPAGAVNLADGGQPSGAIGNHGTHVHYASDDPRSMLIVAKIVKKHGGILDENPAVGAVDPTAHSQTGFHYKTISGKAKGKLARKTGLKGETLGMAWDITAPGNDPEILMAINHEIAERTGAPVSGAVSGGTISSAGTPATIGATAPGVMPGKRVGKASDRGGRYLFYSPKATQRRLDELQRQSAQESELRYEEAPPSYGLGSVDPAEVEDVAGRYGFR